MSISSQTLRLVAADSTVVLIFRIVALPVMFGLNWVMVRFYGAEQTGVYCIALNLAGMLTLGCGLGLETGLLRFMAGNLAQGQGGDWPRLLRPAVALVGLLATVAALLMYASGGALARWFGAPHLPTVLGLVALSLPALAVSRLLTEAIRALGGVRWLVLEENLLTPLVFLGLLVGLAAVAGGPLSLPRMLGSAFLGKSWLAFGFLAGLLWWLARPRRGEPTDATWRGLLHYSWPIYLTNISLMLFGYLDILILGLFTDPAEVAYYNVATKIAIFVSFPLVAVNAVVPPLFARFHQLGDLAQLENLAQSSARWMYYAALPVSLLVVLLAPHLLGAFGQEFLKARVALAILVASQLVNVTSGSVGVILQMTGHQREMMRLRILVGLASLALMPVLAYSQGLNGIALASALSIAAINLLMLVTVWRRLHIKAFAASIRMANLGGILGLALFLLSLPVVGPVGASAAFLAGYTALVTKTIRQELRLLRRAQGIEVSV